MKFLIKIWARNYSEEIVMEFKNSKEAETFCRNIKHMSASFVPIDGGTNNQPKRNQ